MNDVDFHDFDTWIQLGSMANSYAMDWYALTHDQPLPSQSLAERTFGIDFGSVSPRVGLSLQGATGGQLLLWGLVIVGGLYVIAKVAK